MKNNLVLILILLILISCNNNENQIINKNDSLLKTCREIKSNSTYDTLFIKELKSYFNKETDVVLQGKFYTDSATGEDSIYILCVSLPDKVEKPTEYTLKTSSLMKFLMKSYPVKESELNYDPDYLITTDLKEIKEKEKINKEKGYDVYYFNANINASTLLTKELLTSKERLSIIVFHELMHNYIDQKNLKISIYYNEAICSVIGHYLALKYARETNKTDTTKIKNEINITEQIFQCINNFTTRINSKKENDETLIEEFEKERKLILSSIDTLPTKVNKRKINNAYLLSSGKYSKKYFDIKELYLKHSITKDFLKILYEFLQSDQDYTSFL